MGTNFYLMTKNKEIRDKYFGYDYKLTDEPDWGISDSYRKDLGGMVAIVSEP